MNNTTIQVEKLHMQNGNVCYRAYIGECWGETAAEAVGNLMLQHGKHIGFDLVGKVTGKVMKEIA